MKKILLLLPLVLFHAALSQAQQVNIKGSIADSTMPGYSFTNAAVYLIRCADSVLVSFTRCNTNGGFSFSSLPQNRYLLFIKYPGYAEWSDTLPAFGTNEVNLGKLYLRNKIKVLEEVIVRQRIPAIRVKGDTTEYKADSFYVPPNATVEDLLKVLPGLRVNAKGEIFAQAEKIEKVLVDGEEFFSDDPAVVIRNLRADYIDKVQVYDKKSDQAKFTGVDDGQKAKTINLKLKEDKRMSYFGKAEAGSSIGRYYYGKGMINSFNKRSKLAAYITKDNTHYQALSFDEQNSFSTNLNMVTQLRDDGTMSLQASADEFGWGKGFPNSVTGGLVYNTRWDEDAQKINNTYQYNNLIVNGDVYTASKTILPGVVFNTNKQSEVRAAKIRNLLNTEYEWQIDTSAMLKITARGTTIHHNDFANSNEATTNEQDGLLNQSTAATNAHGDKSLLKSSFLFQKKLKKKGRTLSVAADINLGRQNNKSYLRSFTRFYDGAGGATGTLDIDQYKPQDVRENREGVRLAYTEPLSNRSYIEFSYLLAGSQNFSARYSYDRNGSHYDKLVDSLSSRIRFNNGLQAGGIYYRLALKKLNINFGSAAGYSRFFLNDLLFTGNFSRRFFVVLPSAGINYNSKSGANIRLEYSGHNFNPSVWQIQPLRDNSNPLNLVIGNEQLDQAYVNNLSLDYMQFIPQGEHFIMGKIFYRGVANDFSTASFTDNAGRRVSQFINVSGNYSAGINLMYTASLGKGFQWVSSINNNTDSYSNIVNNVRNTTRSQNTSIDIGVQRYNGSKISFNVNFRPVYSTSRSSIDKVFSSFWKFESNPDFSIRLPGKIIFSLKGELYLYGKGRFATPDNIYLFRSEVKKFFATDKWMIMLSVNDILNKNAAVERSLSSNYISQTIYTNIRRYGMLTIAYNFNKTLQNK